MMLRVNHVVIRLRKAAGDGFHHSKEAVQQRSAEEWVVNEIVRDAIMLAFTISA